jgi:hypothetical protein
MRICVRAFSMMMVVGSFVQASAAPAPAPSPVLPTTPICSGRILFSDNFRSFDPSWGAPNKNVFIASPPSGPAMNISAPTGGGYYLGNGKAYYRNVDICVLAGAAATSATDEMGGIVFWISGPNDFYYFVTTVGGNIALLRMVAGQWTGVVKLHQEPALHTGAGIFNQIDLRLFGNQGVVEINGKILGGFTGVSPPNGSQVGLLIEASSKGPTTWAFMNFLVMDPMMH